MKDFESYYKAFLAFSDSNQEDTPILVIEPQAAALLSLKKEDHTPEFAGNAGMHDLKLKEGFLAAVCFSMEKCSSYFKEEELLLLRMMHMEMENTTLDLLILAPIRCHIHKGKEMAKTKQSHRLVTNEIVWTISMKSRMFVAIPSCTFMQYSRTVWGPLLNITLRMVLPQAAWE